MIIRLLLIAFVWLGSILVYDVNYQELYILALDFLHAHRGQMMGLGILAPLLLLLCSFFLGRVSFFSPLYLLVRVFFEANQLFIYLLSFAAVVFWFDFRQNLWLDLGMLAALPFVSLIASCYSLWIFDFNYPLSNRIQRNLLLPAISLVIIFVAAYVG
jgi:hypothetical protein